MLHGDGELDATGLRTVEGHGQRPPEVIVGFFDGGVEVEQGVVHLAFALEEEPSQPQFDFGEGVGHRLGYQRLHSDGGVGGHGGADAPRRDAEGDF